MSNDPTVALNIAESATVSNDQYVIAIDELTRCTPRNKRELQRYLRHAAVYADIPGAPQEAREPIKFALAAIGREDDVQARAEILSAIEQARTHSLLVAEVLLWRALRFYEADNEMMLLQPQLDLEAAYPELFTGGA